MTQSNDEVYNFIKSCINNKAAVCCNLSFNADIKIKKCNFSNIDCHISVQDTPAYYAYIIHIDDDNNELIRELGNHSYFWSNEKYCKMKYISNKKCLKIKNINDDLELFIYPNK